LRRLPWAFLAPALVVFGIFTFLPIGTPLDLYNRPANAFVAGFIGTPRMNFMKGSVAATDGGLVMALDGTCGIIATERLCTSSSAS